RGGWRDGQQGTRARRAGADPRAHGGRLRRHLPAAVEPGAAGARGGGVARRVMGWFSETLALVRARYAAMLLASSLAFLPANLLAFGALRFGVGLFGGSGVAARVGDSSDKDLLISQKGSSPEQRARETPKTES